MNILLVLKYVPTLNSDFKSGLLNTVIHGLESNGHNVTIYSAGENRGNSENIILGRLSIWEKFIYRLKKTYSKIKSREYYYSKLINNYSVITDNKRHNYDVIYSECTSGSVAIISMYLSRYLKIPYVIREHRSHYFRHYNDAKDIPPMEFEALNNANLLLTVSDSLRDKIREFGFIIPIEGLPNSIPINFNKVENSSNKLLQSLTDWRDDSYLFGAWTNWRKVKRVDLLVQSFVEFKKSSNSNSNVKLLIVGPIADKKEYLYVKKIIKNNNLENSVYLYGKADRSEISFIASIIDCCVISSDYETFGLPVIEAHSFGKPVISTKCGGPESIIINEKLGVLVKKDSVSSLTCGYRNIYENRKYYEANKEYIKRYSLSNYSYEHIFKELSSKLKNVVNSTTN